MTNAVTDLSARRKAAQRAKRGAMVLDAWDRLFPEDKQAKRVGKPSTLDINPDVRRKAKSQL